MPKILTKTNIKTDQFSVFKSSLADGSTKWTVEVPYEVETQEGENFNKIWQFEITGALKTTISNFFDNLVNKVKTQEGL